MKKNEKLLEAIGGAEERFIPDLSEQRSKKTHTALFASIGGGVCAAAVAGVMIFWGVFGERLPELPMVSANIGSVPTAGGVGCEWAYDISELNDINPWNESTRIKTMPVYKNKAYTDGLGGAQLYYTFDELKAIAESTAEKLGVTITRVESETMNDFLGLTQIEGEIAELPVFYKAYFDGSEIGAVGGQYYIAVHGNGSVFINFGYGVPLPDEYNFNQNVTQEETEAAGMFLVEKYKALLPYEDIVCTSYGNRNIYEEFNRSVVVYEKAETEKQTIINSELLCTYFYPSDTEDNAVTAIRISSGTQALEVVAEYPIISYKQAVEKLEQGIYMAGMTKKALGSITEEMIERANLVYRTVGEYKYYLPFYEFKIDITEIEYRERGDMKSYMSLYVPAVNEKYIEDYDLFLK